MRLTWKILFGVKFCKFFMPWFIVVHNFSHATCHRLRKWPHETFVVRKKCFLFRRLSGLTFIYLICSSHFSLQLFKATIYRALDAILIHLMFFPVYIMLQCKRVGGAIWNFRNFVALTVAAKTQLLFFYISNFIQILWMKSEFLHSL